MFGSTGFIHPETMQDQQDALCEQFPAVSVNDHLVHVFEDDHWNVWLNTQDMEFTGLCIGTGKTRDEAVAMAVAVCEAVAAHLQKPSL